MRGSEDGRIDGLVVQDPFRMGQLGVTTLISHLEGRAVETRIFRGVTLVTQSDMNDEATRSLPLPARAEGAESSLAGPKSKGRRIAMIPKATGHDYWLAVHAGSDHAERRLER
ncbi:hypothetical protein OJF2_58740 [Aquisphaera giovannonii]|uniref:LacI family transcriptional regulator n=1 Tax=Aquisphaera giovannonii TaxID=406548 RepID=A0A5B9WAJ7_9BACT|nr:hypothetical protein OJF2_58740 [Aquisphaera giovannonii]